MPAAGGSTLHPTSASLLELELGWTPGCPTLDLSGCPKVRRVYLSSVNLSCFPEDCSLLPFVPSIGFDHLLEDARRLTDWLDRATTTSLAVGPGYDGTFRLYTGRGWSTEQWDTMIGAVIQPLQAALAAGTRKLHLGGANDKLTGSPSLLLRLLRVFSDLEELHGNENMYLCFRTPMVRVMEALPQLRYWSFMLHAEVPGELLYALLYAFTNSRHLDLVVEVDEDEDEEDDPGSRVCGDLYFLSCLLHAESPSIFGSRINLFIR